MDLMITQVASFIATLRLRYLRWEEEKLEATLRNLPAWEKAAHDAAYANWKRDSMHIKHQSDLTELESSHRLERVRMEIKHLTGGR